MTDIDIEIPDQPDGIEDDSYDLPELGRAAERVREYICANGDGVYDVIDGHPLYARDLEALRRAADVPWAAEQLTAALAKVREQLTAATRRADGLANDLRSAVTANTAYANENARMRSQLAELTEPSVSTEPHADLGGPRHHAPNGCDDCSVEPGDWHRYPECPGNLRAIERAGATR